MLIAFSGLKGSGKDTAAEVLVKEYSFTKIAFADAVKEMALVIDPWIPVVSTYGKFDESFNVSTANVKLSQLVVQFGWDKIKRDIPEVRRLLQKIGTEAGRMFFGENVWVDLLSKRFPDIAEDSSRYVITDCRFDNEVDFVHQMYGDVCWIDRPGVKSDGHASESDSIRTKADYIFNNDSSIEELQEDVRFLLFLKGVDKVE